MKKISQKIRESFKQGFWKGTGFAVAILTTTLLAVAGTTLKVWNPGDVLTSADLNARFDAVGGQIVNKQSIYVYCNSTTETMGLLSDAASFTSSAVTPYTFQRPAIIKNLRVYIVSANLNQNVGITIRNITTASILSTTVLSTATTGSSYATGTAQLQINSGDAIEIQKLCSFVDSSVNFQMRLDYEIQ